MPGRGLSKGVISDLAYFRGLQSFRSLLNLELNLVSFVECSKTFSDDRLVMDEHVLTRLSTDEAETLGSVEPLDHALFHGTTPH